MSVFINVVVFIGIVFFINIFLKFKDGKCIKMIILFFFFCYRKENLERVKNFLIIFRRKKYKIYYFFKENYV